MKKSENPDVILEAIKREMKEQHVKSITVCRVCEINKCSFSQYINGGRTLPYHVILDIIAMLKIKTL